MSYSVSRCFEVLRARVNCNITCGSECRLLSSSMSLEGDQSAHRLQLLDALNW